MTNASLHRHGTRTAGATDSVKHEVGSAPCLKHRISGQTHAAIWGGWERGDGEAAAAAVGGSGSAGRGGHGRRDQERPGRTGLRAEPPQTPPDPNISPRLPPEAAGAPPAANSRPRRPLPCAEPPVPAAGPLTQPGEQAGHAPGEEEDGADEAQLLQQHLPPPANFPQHGQRRLRRGERRLHAGSGRAARGRRGRAGLRAAGGPRAAPWRAAAMGRSRCPAPRRGRERQVAKGGRRRRLRREAAARRRPQGPGRAPRPARPAAAGGGGSGAAAAPLPAPGGGGIQAAPARPDGSEVSPLLPSENERSGQRAPGPSAPARPSPPRLSPATFRVLPGRPWQRASPGG